MQFKLLIPVLLIGAAIVCSGAPSMATRYPHINTIKGNITTPDGSVIGYNLYKDRTATGTPLILILGNGQVQSDCRDVIGRLTSSRPVLTFDLRGIGESTVRNYSSVTLENMAGDVHLLTQHFGWKNINLLGYSLGTLVSEQFMHTYSANVTVEHLVMVSSTYKSGNEGPILPKTIELFKNLPMPPSAQQWRDLIHKLFLACLTPKFDQDARKVAAFLRKIDDGMTNRTPEAMQAQAAASSMYDLTDYVKAIQQPTLILHGAQDVGQLPRGARQIHALIQGSKYIEYPNGGHLLFDTTPEIVKEINLGAMMAVCSGAAINIQRQVVAGSITTPDGSVIAYTLHKARKATGTPLVLVSGHGQVQSDWRDIVPHFTSDRPVLTFDNRGVGESSVRNVSLVTRESMAGDISLLVQHLGWSKINLLGFSMGSIVVQEFMKTYASDFNVEHFILVASSYKGGDFGPFTEEVGRWIDALPSLPPNDRDWKQLIRKIFVGCLNYEYRQDKKKLRQFIALTDSGKNRDFEVFMQQGKVTGIYNYAESDSKINSPTLILHATNDTTLLVRGARQLHALMPGSKYIEYPNGEHVLFETSPEIIPEIKQFIANK
ncbi:hypothetical protein BGX28_003129 [Mortierella sp. GBA30]|nr:hypothetical protein BGX28_003129 [Mortierella sp. GBA30]